MNKRAVHLPASAQLDQATVPIHVVPREQFLAVACREAQHNNTPRACRLGNALSDYPELNIGGARRRAAFMQLVGRAPTVLTVFLCRAAHPGPFKCAHPPFGGANRTMPITTRGREFSPHSGAAGHCRQCPINAALFDRLSPQQIAVQFSVTPNIRGDPVSAGFFIPAKQNTSGVAAVNAVLATGQLADRVRILHVVPSPSQAHASDCFRRDRGVIVFDDKRTIVPPLTFTTEIANKNTQETPTGVTFLGGSA